MFLACGQMPFTLLFVALVGSQKSWKDNFYHIKTFEVQLVKLFCSKLTKEAVTETSTKMADRVCYSITLVIGLKWREEKGFIKSDHCQQYLVRF